jgi:hypothetical protein
MARRELHKECGALLEVLSLNTDYRDRLPISSTGMGMGKSEALEGNPERVQNNAQRCLQHLRRPRKACPEETRHLKLRVKSLGTKDHLRSPITKCKILHRTGRRIASRPIALRVKNFSPKNSAQLNFDRRKPEFGLLIVPGETKEGQVR